MSFVRFFSIFLLSLVTYQHTSMCDAAFVGSSSLRLGTCESSPIKSASNDPNYITCHAHVTYDDGSLGTKTIGGHITTDSCDINKMCASFKRYVTNPRCTNGFCCLGTKLCSRQPSDNGSLGSGVSIMSIMLILSTLAITFSMYM